MCVFSTPTPVAMAAPPPVEPRQDTDTSLPVKKEVVDPDTIADIAYGTGGKKAGPAAGKKKGTDQLKINLNTGDSGTGSKTGGANV